MTKSTCWVFPTTWLLVVLIFFSSLSYYFFQDDWFVLDWARNGSFLSFFNFRSDIIYWRPLSMPLLFYVTQKLFGLNALNFHILAFLIFFTLTIAIYKLFETLTHNRKISLGAAFLYGIWPIHYISLSWFSTTSYIMGPLFESLSFIFFLKFSDKNNLGNYIYSVIFFLLAISSSEFSLVLPVIFLIWRFLFKNKTKLKFIIPFVLVDAVLIFIRVVLIPLPATGDYKPVFNFQLLNNFLWYISWSMGIPESFKSLIFPRLPEQSLKVLTQFWQITIPVSIFFILISRQIMLTFKQFIKHYVFGFLWFLVGLLPVIATTGHSFPNYLSFSGLGFLYIVLVSFKNSKNLKFAQILILWLVISCTSTQFTRNTHWIRNEQAISKAYVDYAKKIMPNPPDNSVLLFKNATIPFQTSHHFVLVVTEDALKQSLNNQSAAKVIYGNPSLISLYEANQNNTNAPPKGSNVIEITPGEK